MSDRLNFRSYDVIKHPVVTEKTQAISENGIYTFEVALDATKLEIKKAVEQIYSTKVSAVNTLVRKGKKKNSKGRSYLKSDTKRAYVALVKGDSIDLEVQGE